MARPHRNAAQWQALIEEQARSGLSISDYCKQQGITESGFYTHKKKLAQIEPPEADWIALPTTEASPSNWDIELSLPSRIVLRMKHRPC